MKEFTTVAAVHTYVCQINYLQVKPCRGTRVPATTFDRHWQWANIAQVVNIILLQITEVDAHNYHFTRAVNTLFHKLSFYLLLSSEFLVQMDFHIL